MQPSKIKLSLAIGALCFGASGASMADTFDLTVNTINDVTITEVTALNFGENITTDANGVCAMDADTPPAATMLTDTIAVFDGTTYGVITGTSCIGSGVTVATPGVYSIAGEAGLTVNITVQDEVQAAGDFTFNPAGGVAVSYVDGATNDTAEALLLNTAVPVRLADATGGPEVGGAVDGRTRFTVGGTITTGPTGLSSDTDYVATFNVNVIY